MEERFSYCLLFFALVTLAQGRMESRQVLPMLPMSEKARKLAWELAS